MHRISAGLRITWGSIVKRNVRIEFFRCFCMFGIVLIHALGQGGYAGEHRWLGRLFTPSVVGFIFISGYFGMRFSLGRVVRLIGIGIGCAITITTTYHVIGNGETSVICFCRHVWAYTQYAWFLWMYIALMVLAPLVEPLFAQKRTVELVPLIIMIFGWSYLATKVPIAQSYVPNVVGFGGFGVLTFLGVYCVARATRLFELDNIKTIYLVIALIVSIPFVCIGFSHYHSPFALVLAGSCFYLFKRLPIERIGERFCKFIHYVSPSLFAVYLLHNNSAGLTWLAQLEDRLIGECMWEYHLASLLVAICFFVSCLILDVPRRFVSCFLNRIIADRQ